MKKIPFIILTLILICLSGACVSSGVDEPSSTDSYVYFTGQFPTDNTTLSDVGESMSVTGVFPVESYSSQVTSEIPSSAYYTTTGQHENSTSTLPSEPPTLPTAAPTTLPQQTTVPQQEEPTVDLTIDLPESNGKMEVDKSPSNKLISAVVTKKKIDSAFLVAVYSVPESGQNYVLEFIDKNKKTKDNLRRVYLLDRSGNIKSVAAEKSREKENISSTENWFCFNVLIKGVIFDAIADKLK